jgi:hypothetical protein
MHKAVPVLLLVLFLAGCRRDMQDQPAYRPLQRSDLFADERASRPLLEGTVARGQLRAETEYYTGRKPGVAPQTANVQRELGQKVVPPDEAFVATFSPDLVTQFPVPVTRQLMERGRERFNMYCTPCHDYTGSGQGMIVQRGLKPPPSFHIDRLRQAPVGHFFDVMTNGYGAMYSYASRVSVADRWAIIAYIRALQLSQAATINDVPEQQRAALASAPPQTQTGPGEMSPGPRPPTTQQPPNARPEKR